jgi:hypothetical protein
VPFSGGRGRGTRGVVFINSPSRTPLLLPSLETFPSAMDSSVHSSSKVADRWHIQFWCTEDWMTVSKRNSEMPVDSRKVSYLQW